METNVSAGYFAALGIPLLEGRTFEPDDYQKRLGCIVISQSVARRYWPKGSALGKRMTSWSPKAERQGWYTVVGVVGDVRLAGGVVSYLVTRRTRELGIRMALGADVGRIRRLILGQGSWSPASASSPACSWPWLPPGSWRRCCSRWGAGIR